MVCSACGYENQVGNRFCGMCGTPLPHRPLTAPGAHGTHTFTRVPWGNERPAREDARSSLKQANETIPEARRGVLSETPSTEQPAAGNSVLASRDMVPEIPLEEYVKGFRYAPPAEPDETTMHGDAEALRAEASAMPDSDAIVAVETTTKDPNSPSATEDVRERLGLDEAAPEEDRHDRPRFLDFSEPAAAPEKSEAAVPAIAGPSFLGLSDTSPSADPPLDDADRPHDRGWTWLAVAALLCFVLLAVLEWRAQGRAENNGPVEVVKTKLRSLWHSSGPAFQGSGSADTNAAKPTMQVEEQPKSQAQDVAASPNSANAASAEKSAVSNSVNTAANAPQATPAVTKPEPSSGQQQTASLPSASTTGSKSTTGQKTAELPPGGPKTVSAPGARNGAETAAVKPKPRVQAELENGSDSPAKKLAPGEQELAKASDASDAAAAAAWLWKATAKGNPEAPVRLADMYVKGDGVPRSCEQALVLLQAAADKGNAQARARLAQMNNSGSCAQRAR